MKLLAGAYLVVTVVMSIVTLAAFGIDKRRAKVGGQRFSEKLLHILAASGGWPGALIGQRVFRHKTIKLSFRMVLWLIVILHLIAIGFWALLYVKG